MSPPLLLLASAVFTLILAGAYALFSLGRATVIRAKAKRVHARAEMRHARNAGQLATAQAAAIWSEIPDDAPAKPTVH